MKTEAVEVRPNPVKTGNAWAVVEAAQAEINAGVRRVLDGPEQGNLQLHEALKALVETRMVFESLSKHSAAATVQWKSVERNQLQLNEEARNVEQLAGAVARLDQALRDYAAAGGPADRKPGVAGLA